MDPQAGVNTIRQTPNSSTVVAGVVGRMSHEPSSVLQPQNVKYRFRRVLDSQSSDSVGPPASVSSRVDR